ncbi:MAG: hypothetical protein WBG57_03175, partial [Ornithinimicrobium sp.]
MNSPPQAHMARRSSDPNGTNVDVDVDVLTAAPAVGPLIARAAARGAVPSRGRSGTASLPSKRVVLCDQRVDIEQLA